MFGIDLDDLVSNVTESAGLKGIENVSDSNSFGAWLQGVNGKEIKRPVLQTVKTPTPSTTKKPFDFSLNNPVVLVGGVAVVFFILKGK